MSNELVIPEGLSKHERKEFKRNYYREQQLRQSRSSQFKKYSVIALVGLVLLGGGYWLVKEASKPQPGEFVTSLGNRHLKDMNEAHDPYNSLPPTSGPHLGSHAQWGVSNDPIPDELQIHSLEDGGVMVQYNCTSGKQEQDLATSSAQEADECKKLVEQLASIVKKYPDKVAMAPYPKLDNKIALTAWTRIDKFNDFDEARIQKFIKAFKGIDHHWVIS